MKYISLLLFVVLLFTGCSVKKMTEEEKNAAKNQIKIRIERFLDAYEKKDMKAIVPMLSTSNGFFYFGSDISEINESILAFQNQVDQDWKLFDSIEFGDIRNLSIVISDYGDLGTAIYEIPAEAVVRGTQTKFNLRMSNSFINENGLWQLSQGMASIPSVGESSAELNIKKNSYP